MTEERFVQCITEINNDLQKQKWKRGKIRILAVLADYLEEPLKCTRDTVQLYLNRLRCLIGGYMYCIENEHAKGCIIEDIEIIQAITCCKAFAKEFEKENEKDQEMVNTYCGLATVSQKIHLSRMRKLDPYEEQKNQADLRKLLRKKQTLERMDYMDHVWHKILSGVKEVKIPRNSLCIEFVDYLDYRIILENTTNKSSLKISILLHQQIGEKVCSRWIGKITSINEVSKMVFQCIESILLSEEDMKEKLLKSISDSIIKPVWPYLGKVKTLFWISSSIFSGLPMEVLFECNGKRRLLDIYFHVYLDSLLDCREDEKIDISHTSALVMGAPAYAVPINGFDQEKDKQSEKQMRELEINELPCSQQECKIIGELCHTVPLIGEQADKSSFFEKCETSEMIHLSTHGDIFDSDVFAKVPLAGIFLIMSGYKNWYVGRYTMLCGNGCLTAQEITMTDLKKTKLVVISSCVSASNVYKNDGYLCSLRGAFEAAGAWQTVAALWEVDDCATGILMVLFYRYLYDDSPSIALHRAKKKIRELDYQGIRNDRELFSIWQKSNRKVLPDYARPFDNEIYWSAFICHRSRVS